jgi:serine/threonine-protein kinase
VKLCPVCGSQYPDDVRFCPNDGQTLRGAAPATDLVGQVVADRYHVVKKLGEGGMGQVYLAEHVKMGRRSAIKVMNPSMTHDPDAVARFNREAANASRITHPNVCAIYDFGETPEGLIYLAMEFVEGEPLTDALDREGALTVPRATHLFAQVADALQAAHDLGIVHRDLKPDNIMVARGRGGADVVKVVDFGIAKAVGGDAAGQKVTKTGLVVGTPEFMSPEQLAGDAVDGRSDLYSLALVYFRMLTGKLPFEADTVQETMVKRLTDEPAKLAAARPDLAFPAGLQAVLDAALTRTPVDRYQSVAKFAEDVRAITGLAAPARGAIPATRADADGATQLLDTTATKQMAGRRAAAPPAMPPRRRSVVPVAVGAVLLVGAAGAAVALFNGGNGAPNGDGDKRDSVLDTTSRAGGGTVPRPTPPDGSNRRDPDTTTRTPTPLKVDSVAIFAELGDMIDGIIEPATRAKTMQRALDLFDDEAVPVTLRGQAAFIRANGFLQDQRNQDACRWAANAARLEPANVTYRQFRSQWGCS